MSIDTAREVLLIESKTIKDLADRLDDRFERALDLLAACRERVALTGMGKSGIICRKIAATLSSTGTPSIFVHPAEAIHGDLGMFKDGDMVIAISNSGETQEILNLIPFIKRQGLKLISLCGNPYSTLARHSDVFLDVGIAKEACPMNLVPTASTTAALAMGDALAIALFRRKDFHEKDFVKFHPGGQLGRKLMEVKNLMHTGESLPVVSPETELKEAVLEMSSRGFGVTAVADDRSKLLGIITDGDLRRTFQSKGDIGETTAEECMTADPKTIGPGETAAKALKVMENMKITCLLVTGEDGKLEGLLHIHDLWRLEMF